MEKTLTDSFGKVREGDSNGQNGRMLPGAATIQLTTKGKPSLTHIETGWHSNPVGFRRHNRRAVQYKKLTPWVTITLGGTKLQKTWD